MKKFNLNYYLRIAKEFSYQSRIDIIKTVYKVKGGHLGGSLSVIDILSSIYSFYNSHDYEVILSKGHCVLAWLVTLVRVGEIESQTLDNFYSNKSNFGGHPKKNSSKSITWSTGSLGHGLSVVCGKALAKPDKKYFCILGDGEMNEGSVWEGLMFLSQHQISNVLVLIDNNKQESLAKTDEILSIECLEKKIGGMKISVDRINGHEIEILIKEINHFLNDSKSFKNPRVLICDTVKGKGVSFMEKIPMWHHRKLKENEYLQALKELS